MLVNLSIFFKCVVAIASIVLSVLALAYFECLADDHEKGKNLIIKRIKFTILLMCLSLPLACIPEPKDVWEMRISLIKFNLASPENIQKGADEIARIGKKLECKYLGCEEKK
jgi:hypothetical protein